MNTNRDLISVIIPAYNHEKYVQAAIQSLIDQTYQNLELIVIDDGSVDGTWEKINEMKEMCERRFRRVVFEHQENSGTVAVLNKTLYMANGKYLYYLASDDLVPPDAIEILRNNVGDAAFIFPDLALIDESGKRFYLTDSQWSKTTYNISESKYKTYHEAFINSDFPDIDRTSFDWYENLLRACCMNIGFLMLKEAAIECGGWKDKNLIIEDYYMYLQIAKRYKIKRLKRVLFYYRRHVGNISVDDDYMYTGVYHIFMNEKDYCYRNGHRAAWDTNFLRRFRKTLPRYKRFLFRVSAYMYRKFGIQISHFENWIFGL